MVTLEEFQQYFVRIHHHLNELGLVHWLIGSSLLGPLRDGHFIEGDKEINFGVMADELAEVKPKLMEDFKLILSPNVSRVSGVYLMDETYKGGDIWKHPKPFTWLAPHYVTGEKIVQCVGRGHILYWDKDILLPMAHMEFNGECYTCPNQREKWLEAYYGPGWKKREENWHWLNNSHNHINLEELGIC